MSASIKSEIEWLKSHAEFDGNVWKCKNTGEPILVVEIGRSIHITPGAGMGEVRNVEHLHCPRCEPDKQFPENGEPILEGELIG